MRKVIKLVETLAKSGSLGFETVIVNGERTNILTFLADVCAQPKCYASWNYDLEFNYSDWSIQVTLK
jgi:hypothetical protein